MRRPFSRSRARFRRIEWFIEHFAYALIVFYALFSFAHWLSDRAIFRIEHVEVLGGGAVDEREVAALAQKPLSGTLVYRWIRKDNAILYPSSRVSHMIEESSGWIDRALVRAMRQKVQITLVEHVPAFHWCPDDDHAEGPIPSNTCWYADDEGRIFIMSPAYSGYPFVRIIGDEQGTSTGRGTYIMDPKAFVSLRAFIHALEREGVRVRSAVHMGKADYRIRSDMPWDILWEMTEDIDSSIRALTLAVQDIARRDPKEKKITEIDLRFNGKVFYR